MYCIFIQYLIIPMKVNYIGKISEENLPAIFVPYFLESVHAGFPSPASDYIESPIDLNKHLIKNGAATFLVRAQGQSMVGSGITDQAVLIVDRSIKPLIVVPSFLKFLVINIKFLYYYKQIKYFCKQ